MKKRYKKRMNKSITNVMITRAFLLLLVVAGAYSITSCSDDEKIGAPVITQVRLINPALQDSTFTEAFPGIKIVVEGQNFRDVRSVAMNNTLVDINPTYVKDGSIIVEIPEDLPLRGTDASLPNQIKVTTAHGEAIYSFTFLSPAPAISQFNFSLPATVGETLDIVGANFYNVQKVVFATGGQTIDVTEFKISSTYDTIYVTIPDGGDADGTITVITESGNASKVFRATVNPFIASISTDMPVWGDSLVLSGEYFIGIKKIVLPGNVEVPASAIHINASQTRLAFITPRLQAVGTLKIVTSKVEISNTVVLNDTTKDIYNHDGIGNWAWAPPQSANGISPAVARRKFTQFMGTIPAYTGWSTANGYAINSWPTSISDDTPISNLKLKFNFYTGYEWKDAVYIDVRIANNENYSVKLEPWKNGTVPVGRWIEFSIPLSDFNVANVTTYTDWKKLPLDNAVVIIIANGNEKQLDVNFCIDDIRIVKE
jgi:hypothetical protein